MSVSELFQTVIVPILVALLTGGGIGLFTYQAVVRQINAKASADEALGRKSDAEATDVIAGGAQKVVSLLTEQLEVQQAELKQSREAAEADKTMREQMSDALVNANKALKEMEISFSAQLEAERQARRRDAEECKEAIEKMRDERDERAELLNKEVHVLRNQIINLKRENTKLKRRLSEIEGHTPPPHKIPEDFMDPPEPDSDPDDWH